MIRVSGLTGQPAPPASVADEIELYARQWGRHAVTRWDPEMGCFKSTFSLRPDDPQLRAWQEGRDKQAEPPTESVLWWDWTTNRPMDLEAWGAGGIRKLLEEGNTWSGRGKFATLEEGVKAAREQRLAAAQKAHDTAKQSARERGQDQRRQILRIPYHRVGIDLKTGT